MERTGVPSTGHAARGSGPASQRPTIVLVDDAVEVRTLVRARLRLSHLIEVVGEGGTGHDAIDLAERLQPDLVLLDVSMPGMDGLEALPQIRQRSPGSRVVMYSGFAEEGLAQKALDLGATAFIQKSASLDSLAQDLLDLLGASPDGTAVEEPTPFADVDGPAAPHDGWVDTTSVEPVLLEHLERFREVFEDAAIGMATMTLAGRIVRANPSMSRLTGRAVSDLVTTSLVELVGSAADDAREALQQVTAGARDVVQLEHGVAGDSDRRLLTTLSPVRDAAQRPLYLFLQVQDVSAQRAAEERLRRSEHRFRLLVEAVQDYAIFMLDPEGHIDSWNAGAQRIKGWTAEEIVGRHFRTFYPLEQQEARHPEQELVLAIRDGRYEEEGWRVRKDGSTFWAQVTITAVRDDDGTLIGFAKVTRDVTERRRMLRDQQESARALAAANTQLASANERLQRSAEDQAQFLALTAHELRSPVGVLGGTAGLLQEHWNEVEPEQRGELFGAMASGASRLQRLLDDLLTASKVRSSALDMQMQVVDLGKGLPTIVREAGLAASPDDVEFRVEPGITVLVDPDRLAQIVENLVRNSLHHGSPPVTLTAEVRDEMADLVVRDAGGGVPERMRQRLFERFATGSRGGTGLGLYIVRVLARAQGGDARYRAEDGAFVVSLPRATDAEEA